MRVRAFISLELVVVLVLHNNNTTSNFNRIKLYLTQINILKLNQIILDQLPIWMVSNYFRILINYYWKSAANCVQRDQMNVI